jgi:DNA-binding transcriptional MerR regulator
MKPNFEAIQKLEPGMTFTLAEAGTMCGVSAPCIRNWEKQGLITLIRVGKRFYVKSEELKKAVIC